MKLIKIACSAAVLAAALTGFDASAWEKAGDKIATEWSETIDTALPWNVYPRPMLKRADWLNLNGLWQYAIVPQTQTAPAEWQGEILVPFAVESSLSGVGRRVGDNEALWYNRTFTVPSAWKGKDVLLNFGAVDWACEVWVNDVKVGSHRGGYTPFSLDITSALKAKGENTLEVRVTDPTDGGYQPRGKQSRNPKGIWYTPVTGIWQTVWLEPVAPKHIESVHIVPDIDRNTLSVDVVPSVNEKGLIAEVKVLDNGSVVATGKAIAGETAEIAMPADVKLWSPDAPNIYNLEVSLLDGGKVADKIDSYAAMRKFSTARDEDGVMRMQLNNKDLFQYGPLDQGWWPDGLYTAPSYEAMVFDIDKTKEWGFNMIRKHVKVEPALWYEYCDKNGILVWQDMPSGDSGPGWEPFKFYEGQDKIRSAESESNYRREWKEIIDALRNNPSIAVWVPFNEAWGQFKTKEIAEWTKQYDPSRLVNPASGGNHYHTGDIIDAHHYPAPNVSVADGGRVTVLGEFGGIGMASPGHLWSPDRNWGYIEFNSPAQVTDEYEKYIEKLIRLAKTVYSAGVYTQTTDVENEVNGLMTYDRKVVKIDEKRVRDINKRLTHVLDK
ncbi:MAG: beta-galactosidase [Bacteroidales bacterium]|nr:beta-galactosidase [Bacteroidales bacterium]